MIKVFLATALVTLALSFDVPRVHAQQFGTAAEARAMLDRAVAKLKAGEAAAVAAFNDKNNKDYRDRDLYVICISLADGKLLATANPALVGTDVRVLKFKDDPFGQRAFDAMQKLAEGTVGTIEYSFPRPGTTEYVPKQTFLARVGGIGLAVGYYK